MKWLWYVLAAVLGLWFLGGCTATLKNKGTVGLEMSTRWVLIHEAAKTSDEPAVSNVELPAVVDWLFKAEPGEPSDGTDG